MQRKMRAGALATLALLGWAGAGQAGPVERACMSSARAGGNQALCGCVQKVADSLLNGADQRMVASFFENPDKAERVRMDPSASANDFWTRYLQFGAEAQSTCKG